MESDSTPVPPAVTRFLDNFFGYDPRTSNTPAQSSQIVMSSLPAPPPEAAEDGDENESVHRVRLARRQRPRNNAIGSSTPSSQI